MRPRIKRALQLLIILAIATLGALCTIEVNESLVAETYVLGLIAVAIAGLSLSEMGAPVLAVQDVVAAPQQDADAREKQFDSALAIVVELIQSHLQSNSQYSDSLKRIARDLPALRTPEKIGEVVALLIEENRKIQTKMNDLSKNLETSRQQVANLRANLAEAHEKVLRDPLTSLGNRRFFDAHLSDEIAEAQNDDREICLALGDLDDFKAVNDRFGHPIGDLVLKRFGELLSHNINGFGTAARFGGDEFAIIFPRSGLTDAAQITDQIRRQLEAKQWMLSGSGQQIGKITASFGLARLCRGESAEALLKRADAKLYEAKVGGRNRVAVDTAA